MGAPVAIGMLVVVLAGLTLGPAVVFRGQVASTSSSPKRAAPEGVGLWRRVGTAVVRWPAPILAVSAAIVLIGIGRAAELQDELQRPLLLADVSPVQSRASGRGPAFLAGADEPRTC